MAGIIHRTRSSHCRQALGSRGWGASGWPQIDENVGKTEPRPNAALCGDEIEGEPNAISDGRES
jgi:hypothetical protein